MIAYAPKASLTKDAYVCLFTQDDLKRQAAAIKPAALQKLVDPIVKYKQFDAAAGSVYPLIYNKRLVLLCGLGKSKDLNPTQKRTYSKQALLAKPLAQCTTIEVEYFSGQDDDIQALIEAMIIGTYCWSKYKKPTSKSVDPLKKKYTIIAKKKPEYDQVYTIAKGVNLTRDLVNDNADCMTSKELEKAVRGLVKGNKRVALEVLNKQQMTKKGLFLHLAVNKASAHEPRLIIVKYQGAGEKDPYTAFVGKGITYDTGGLNLKPTGYMETMRYDMGGSGTVIGLMHNVLKLKLKKNCLFACCIAENAIGSTATKPGDVIKSYSGKTVEIGNTDAEGRLVLADGISYLVKNYKPGRIIDIATLTGAVIVALGHDHTGLMSNNDKLAQALLKAGQETDDVAWLLPNYPELKTALDSNIADLKNIGWGKGCAGSLTAGEFLRQFVENTAWAHLDIAGTAFVDSGKRAYFNYGATGAAVRLLTRFIVNN